LEAEDDFLDAGECPGAACRHEEDGFPALFEALAGEKPPRGKGGPNAPYVPIHRDEALVFDEADGACRRATTDEIDEPRAAKLAGDPFGNPSVYRDSRSRPRRPAMERPHKADLRSLGPDGVDPTAVGEERDDIGNW